MEIINNAGELKKLAEKGIIYLTKKQAKQIGKPLKKGEKPIGIVYFKNTGHYVYDRSQQITYFSFEKNWNSLYLHDELVQMLPEAIYKRLKPSGYTFRSKHLVPVYAFSDISFPKGLTHFFLDDICFPLIRGHAAEELIMHNIPLLHVGFTRPNNSCVEKVYRVIDSSFKHLEIKDKPVHFVSKEWFEMLPKELDVHFNLSQCVAAFRSNKTNITVYYDVKKVLQKEGLTFLSNEEIKQKEGLLFLNPFYIKYNRFPKRWELDSSLFKISGISEEKNLLYGLNEKGLEKIPLISSALSQYLVISLSNLEDAKQILMKANYNLSYLYLVGRTIEGKMVFDITQPYIKKKMRLRLLSSLS